MELGRKGDIGFIEAIAGTMTVCVVMLAFLGFMACEIYSGYESEQEFDWSYLPEISITQGKYCFEKEDRLQSFSDKTGIKGISIHLLTSNGNSGQNATLMFGTETENSHTENKLMKVHSDKDEYIPIVVEVILFA